MRKPVRTVRSAWGDSVTVDFESLTVTRKSNTVGSPVEVEKVADKKAAWEAYRMARATFEDSDY